MKNNNGRKVKDVAFTAAVLAAATTGAVLCHLVYKKLWPKGKGTDTGEKSRQTVIPASCLDELTHDVSKDKIRSVRRKNFCSAQSVSYDNTQPLLIVRGEGQYLYDEKGTAFLDTRNNVGHIGHTHPAVVKAVQVS